MYCKNCGQEIDAAGKFCSRCGAPVASAEKPSKKKVKKPIYKRWWVWAIVIFFLLGSCGSDTETPVETTPQAETAAATAPVETTEDVTEAAEADPVAESATSADLDVAVGLLESVIKDNFENYEIYHENGIIVLNLWEPGIAIGATLAAEGNAENLAAWNDFIEDQKDFSLTLCDFVETLGLDETMVMVNILNDLNKENVLLSIAQGIVISNCVE